MIVLAISKKRGLSRLRLTASYTAKPPEKEENRRLCLSAPNNASALGRKRHRRGCRTGVAQARLLEQGDTGPTRAIITPAHHRTLILVKVPCSIVFSVGRNCSVAITAPGHRSQAIDLRGRPGYSRRQSQHEIMQHEHAEQGGGKRNRQTFAIENS